jgi:hypothetical protein
MLESALVLFIVTALASAAWALNQNFASTNLVQIGLAMLGLGLLEGVPTGLYYHLLLHRFLYARKKLAPRWWISPRLHHIHLSREELQKVHRWFFLGGIGFFLCLTGGLLAISGLLLGRL